MSNTTQTSNGGVRPRKAAPFQNTAKIAASKMSALDKQKAINNFLSRQFVLTIPDDIAKANPDKYFCYINYNEMQKYGMWHPQGYQLFKTVKDSESQKDTKFNDMNDGLVHRNEMVLAWLSKEEYERRQVEKEILKSLQSPGDILTKKEELRGFNAHASETKEQVSLEDLKKD